MLLGHPWDVYLTTLDRTGSTLVASLIDVFVVLLTGYGKSVIYAVLPQMFDFMFGKLMKGLLNA